MCHDEICLFCTIYDQGYYNLTSITALQPITNSALYRGLASPRPRSQRGQIFCNDIPRSGKPQRSGLAPREHANAHCTERARDAMAASRRLLFMLVGVAMSSAAITAKNTPNSRRHIIGSVLIRDSIPIHSGLDSIPFSNLYIKPLFCVAEAID